MTVDKLHYSQSWFILLLHREHMSAVVGIRSIVARAHENEKGETGNHDSETCSVRVTDFAQRSTLPR